MGVHGGAVELPTVGCSHARPTPPVMPMELGGASAKAKYLPALSGELMVTLSRLSDVQLKARRMLSESAENPDEASVVEGVGVAEVVGATVAAVVVGATVAVVVVLGAPVVVVAGAADVVAMVVVVDAGAAVVVDGGAAPV